MTERVVSVKLVAKVDGAVAAFNKAKASVDDLTKAASPSKAQAFKGFADKAAIAGLGIATAVGVAVKRFADFDQAMSAVQANSGATGASLDALRAQAIKLGADSQFSATEAAQGINEMSKAGVAAGDILGGGLKGALDLAAAGQISVADAAETAATQMTVFGLEGSKVPHIADLLAAAASKAQGGVADMSLALNYAGSVAASMGISIEETTGTLAFFASQGIVGEKAGTSFRSMLLSLTAPSKIAAKEMDTLGLNVYDAQGNFIGMRGAADELQRVLGPLNEKTRNAALGQIFGNESIGAAIKLYEGGGDAVATWTKNVDDAGFAAKQAATLTDNLKGDIERMGGALDSVFIQTGSGANGSLRTLVQGVTDLIGTVGEVPGPVLLAGGALTSLALLGPKGVLAYRNYTAQLDSLGLSMDKISTKAPRTGKALDLAGKAAKGFSTALAAAAAVDVLFLDEDSLPIQGLTKSLLESKDASVAFNDAIVKMDTGSEGLGDTLRTAFDPSWFDTAQHKGNQFTKLLTLGMADLGEPLGIAEERMTELDTALSGLVSSGSATEAARQFDDIARFAAKQGVSVDELKAKLPQYSEALAGVANQSTLTSAATGGLVSTTDSLKKVSEEAAQAQIDLAQSVVDAANAMLAASNSDVALAQAQADLAKTAEELNGKTNRSKTAFDLSAKSGRDAQSALNGYAGSARQAAEDNLKAGDSTAAVDKAMLLARAQFVKAATDMGLSSKAANKMADDFGLSTQGVIALDDSLAELPSSKAVAVSVNTTGAKATLTALQTRINGLRGTTVDVFLRTNYTAGSVKVAGMGVVNAGKRAGGGPIYGPGTKTSDSVPLWGSRGEFMQKAAAVDKYGERFMHAVNNLQFPAHLARGYRDGGPIQYAPRGGVHPSSSRSTRSESLAPQAAPVTYRIPLIVDGRQMAEVVFDQAGQVQSGGRSGVGSS